jgi:hypothetical protein
MATVWNADTATLGRLFDSLSALQSAGPDSPGVSRGETRIVVGPGIFVSGPTFTGTGFAFDAAGRPTGGTVTEVGVPWYKIIPGYGVAGIEVPLTTLYAAAVQGAGEALVPGLLGGNDTFLPDIRAAGTLRGYGGDDLFHVQLGPPVDGPPAVDGGAGADTVALTRFDADLRSNTTVEVGSGSLVVGRPDLGERVTCTSVEAIRFDDGTLSFDPAAVGGQAYILFEAALGRAPGAAELGYFADAAERHGLPAAASGLLAAPETQARLDGLDAAGFIDAVYRSALGRGAEPGGLEYWRGRLDPGEGGRGAVLAGIAASDEAEGRWAATIARGVFGADPDAVGVVRAYLAATGAPPNALNLAYFAALPVREIEVVLAYNFAGVPDADFVAALVRNAYGPDASDPEAVAYYTQALSRFPDARADVLHAYAFSPGMDARVAPYVTDHGVLYA